MKGKKRWWDIRAQANADGGKAVEIQIYGDIGFWGTDADLFAAKLDEVAAAVRGAGGDATVVPCDVTAPADVAKLVAAAGYVRACVANERVKLPMSYITPLGMPVVPPV